MKRMLIAILLLAGASSSSLAGPTVWQGDLFVTAVSDAAKCKAVNMSVGIFARGVFRPKGVGSNGNTDLLAWYFQRSAGQIVPTSPAGGMLDAATAATVRIIYGSAGFNQFTNVALDGVDVNPATLTATTPTVAIVATITNAYSSSTSALSGCDITIKGTLSKTP